MPLSLLMVSRFRTAAVSLHLELLSPITCLSMKSSPTESPQDGRVLSDGATFSLAQHPSKAEFLSGPKLCFHLFYGRFNLPEPRNTVRPCASFDPAKISSLEKCWATREDQSPLGLWSRGLTGTSGVSEKLELLRNRVMLVYSLNSGNSSRHGHSTLQDLGCKGNPCIP
jgi:hypothetical protein